MFYGVLDVAFLECLASDPGAELGQARIYYNTTSKKVRLYDGTQWKSVGGVSGSSVTFSSPDGIGPQELQENGFNAFYFPPGSSVKAVAIVKVPSEYAAGSQINLKITQYSPSATNTQLIKSQTYLVSPETDSIFDTTNLHASTNSAITNTLANMAREVVLDLTDASGEINSVAVSPGDLLVIYLYRDTDTDTDEVRVLKDGIELIFG